MQIRTGLDFSSTGTQSGRETVASIELPDGERELLDDFLSRLQSIIRSPAAREPLLADDTRPTRSPRRRRS